MKTQAKSPNVVLFISDQQRADTMPGVRKANVQTPHLEWLVEQGTLFRNAYCTTPMCSPARASILSGLYPHTSGMVANHQERPISNEIHLSPDVRVLADYLKPQGYACAYTGKWHLGTGGDRRGFNEFAITAGNQDVDGPEQNEMLRFAQKIGVVLGGKQRGDDIDSNDYNERIKVGASLLPMAFHRSMRDAQHAAHFVRQMGNVDRPFLLVYSCQEPHPPCVSPRPFDRMYSPEAMPLPNTRRDPGGPRLMRHRNDWQLKPAAQFSDDDLRAMWAGYYGAVSYVDHLLGTILEVLINTDQFDDTLFIFTSDHGEMLGSHGMLYKGTVLYDELMNIPLLIRPPHGLKSPHQTARLVSHVDLVPTILNWCGVEIPGELHGANIRPLVEGGDAPVSEGIAFEYHSSNWGERPSPMRGWRTEEWKYVETIGANDELYNLRDDSLEVHNLIDDPKAAGELEKMKTALHDWLKRTGDRWPEIAIPDREVKKESGVSWN